MNLKQLSKELGLSISSVSKALSNSPEISEATKKKVLSKAKEFNYQANPFASNLRNKKSKTIAVIIPEIANNFFSLAINGVESYAQRKNYHVLIYQTHEDLQKEVSVAKHLMNGRVDGVIISISRQTSNTEHLEALEHKGIPVVYFDRVNENNHSPKVITNDYESAFLGTEHLLQKGCTKIAFLSFSKLLFISTNRLKGYSDALKKAGIKKDNSLIVQCDNDKIANKKLIHKLLTSAGKPDAVFACVEELAISTYEICEEIDIKIPKNIKVMSFSNLQTASILRPSLTSITQPAYEMGREAAGMLFNLIDKNVHNNLQAEMLLPSTLIIRNSTKGNSSGFAGSL